MTSISRTRVVVLGMMSKMPVAGVVWQTLHYLLGFERLGFQAYYVEAHARTPSMLMRHQDDDGSVLAAAFISRVLRPFGLGDRWAFVALHDDGRTFGLSPRELDRLYGAAGMIVNLHGGTTPRPEFARTGRLVYVETDPVQLQVELHHDLQATLEFLQPHCAFFTFAENLGAPDCRLPIPGHFDFRPTRQPVVMDLWGRDGAPPRDTLTTVGNWRQRWRDVIFRDETYTWSKHHEFDKFLDLPARTGRPFELALSSYTEEDRRLLEDHGWRVRPGLELSRELDPYRGYIRRSRGEFTVAKDQNVRLRTGWFSDRSATYLASGRPVITQETGFCNVLPTGEGLFGFTTPDDVVAAVEAIDRDYARHSHAALSLARTYFSHDVVLRPIVTTLGLDAGARRRRPARPRSAFADDLVLTPLSRRPLRLPERTADSVLGSPIGVEGHRAVPREPVASVVVVSFENLLFTRLCLESVLANTAAPAFELIVVDNRSRDGSREYLTRLAEHDRRVRLVLSDRNAGFPAACNQGLAVARGRILVLLNNDTMVPGGWLEGLAKYVEDETIGLVGPVTNRIGNETEVPVSYDTWGEFRDAARWREEAWRGRSFEIDTLTMFCVAMRREVHERVGVLDTGFGLGTLEDDDYSMRARNAGYRLVCAEDVLVHHFGEASFGKLYASGEHGRLMRENRERFRRKWGVEWTAYGRRPDPGYRALVDRACRLVGEHTPPDARVFVVSRGDDAFLAFEGRRASHFPCIAEGAWAGHYPADSAEAVDLFEALRAGGSGYLVVPKPAFWWLEFYDGLARRLDEEAVVVARDDACLIFRFERRGAPAGGVDGASLAGGGRER